MTTKYILHGGFAQHINLHNYNFFKEILKDTKNEVKILLVELAHMPERYVINAEKDKSQFVCVQGEKKLLFEVADFHTFQDQIKSSDVIYISGGTTVRLMETLQHFPNLKELFSGKIVVGESAGANCLAAYCYSKSGGGVMKGLGLVPVKMIPHYIGEHAEKLTAIPEKLEILFLKNYQFKVFNI